MQASKTIIHLLAVASGFALAHTSQPALGQCEVGDRTWTLVAQSGPSPRSIHAMAYDSARGVVVLFGGRDKFDRFNDTWEWDGVTWTLVAESGPSPRTAHAMAYDSARNVTVLFGGFGASFFDDTWEWDGSTWTQRSPATIPLHRTLHAMVYDSVRDRTVLHGGFAGGNEISRETWEWNGSNWSLKSITGPGRRHEHAMAYDSQRGQTVFFGGRVFSVLDDTWEWSGGGWTQHEVTGPSARSRHAMAYDSACAVSVLFGGSASLYSDQTWEWDGLAWSQQFPFVHPSARKDHAMAYDSDRDVVVLFGGLVAGGDGEGGYNWETWEYECVAEIMDCNGNDIADDCDLDPSDPDGDGRVSADCNLNDIPDECDIDDGQSDDCDDNSVPDECEEFPPITEQPLDQTVQEGGFALFAIATDAVQPQYQWQKDGVALTDSEHIIGSQTATLLILDVVFADAGAYDCVVTDAQGCTNTSDAAVLTVTDSCPADFDRDGTVGASDLAQLLGSWGSYEPCPPFDAADFNEDCGVNAADLAQLLGDWGPCS